MGIYLIIPILLFSIGKKWSNYLSEILTFLVILFLFSMRGIDVGTDTKQYYVCFLNPKAFIGEPFFSYLIIFLKKWSSSYNFFLMVIGLVAFVFFIYGVKKNSVDFSLSIFCFFSLGMFFFALNGMRQFVAVAISFYAFSYLLRGEFLKYAFFILLASLFHYSAAIMLFFYPVLRSRCAYIHCLLFLVVAIIVFMTGIHTKFLGTLGYSAYINSVYTQKESGLLLIIPDIALFAICVYYWDKLLKNKPTNLYLINAIMLALVFSIIAKNGLIYSRMHIYFWIYSIILIPEIIARIPIKEKAIAYIPLISFLLSYEFVLLLLNINGVVPYVFLF